MICLRLLMCLLTCNYFITGWLEPLLARIQDNSSNVVAPIIDKISDKTFAYLPTPPDFVGGFHWDLTFHWHALPTYITQHRKSTIDPQPCV